MSGDLSIEDLQKLQDFVDTVKKNPQILWIPQLKFFRDFMESFDGKLPEQESSKTSTEEKTSPMDSDPPSEEAKMESEEEEEVETESEVELDNTGVVEAESEEPPPLGDSSKKVSEEDEIASGEKREEAMMAVSEGDNDKAIELLTEAIQLNPASSALYAKRSSILLRANRVSAALRDANAAVEINPDSAAARKFRGRAHRLLGNWLEAATDLRLACKLDFDEVTDEWLKEVQPNATKLEEHERRAERMKGEKEMKERLQRSKTAQEAHKKAKEESDNAMPGGGGGGGGGFPGGAAPGGMPFNLFDDPDIIKAFEDPEIAAAFQDVSQNPANLFKYKDNPKFASIIEKMRKKFGGGGAGGFPGGAGGFPGGAGGFPGGFPAGGAPGGFPGFPGGFPGAPEGGAPGGTDDLD